MFRSEGVFEGMLIGLWYSRHPAIRLLWPIGALTGLLARCRRALYRAGFFRTETVGCPIVVVGNLSVGGTGKTPLVAWLTHALGERGIRTAVVCRGYGGSNVDVPRLVTESDEAARVGDEAVVLARETGVPVAACKDRVAAARLLNETGDCQLIISDDGLQHFRLARDFEIIVVDGTRGFGNGMCLPVGPLREPVGRLRDVDAIVINGGRNDIDPVPAGDRLLRCATAPVAVRKLGSDRTVSIGQFRGKRVHAVAAIGNPGRFFESLEARGISVIAHPYRDHAVLPPDAFEFGDGLPVMTTHKDAVKCRASGPSEIWVVSSELVFRDGDGESLVDRIASMLESANVTQ